MQTNGIGEEHVSYYTLVIAASVYGTPSITAAVLKSRPKMAGSYDGRFSRTPDKPSRRQYLRADQGWQQYFRADQGMEGPHRGHGVPFLAIELLDLGAVVGGLGLRT